jgi:hypothetical protein
MRMPDTHTIGQDSSPCPHPYWQLIKQPSTAIYDDLGEGSIWRQLYQEAHELPAGYAAVRGAMHSNWRDLAR